MLDNEAQLTRGLSPAQSQPLIGGARAYPGTSRKKKANWIWAVFPAVLVSVGLQVFSGTGVATFFALWCTIFVFCLFAATNLSFSARLGRVDFLEAPVYLSGTCLLLINVFGLFVYFDARLYLPTLGSVDNLPLGLLLSGSGLVTLWIGYGLVSHLYRAGLTRGAKPVAPSWSLVPGVVRVLGLYLVLLVVRAWLITQGLGEALEQRIELGPWRQVILYLPDLRFPLIALVALQVAGRRWPRYLLGVVVLCEGAIGTSTGWSSAFPKALFLIVACSVYERRRLPVRALCLFALATVVSVPVARTMRTADWQSVGSVVRSLDRSAQQVWGGGYQGGWKMFSNLMIKRQSAIAQTPAIYVRTIPGVFPYRPVRELLLAPLAFIPRNFWPSKPTYSDIAIAVTSDYLGQARGQGSSAVTMAGNAYMYGGWPVAITAMFVLGIILGLVYVYLALPSILTGNVGLRAVYPAFVIATFHIGEGDLVSVLQSIVQRNALFLAVVLVACSWKRVAARVPVHRYAVLPRARLQTPPAPWGAS